MGIGSITSMNGMSGLQTTMAGSTDVKSKNIQNEITEIEQQMQKLSSQDELSVDEKADEKKKLQREVSSLNTELERHQEEFLRSQKREMMLAELRKEAPEEEKKSDGRQTEETEQDGRTADRREIVVLKNSDGTVILKGEADQAEKHGIEAGEAAGEEIKAEESNVEAVVGQEAAGEDAEADTGLSHREMYAMVSADASAQQADRQGTVIARIDGDIAVLKGEMNLDRQRGEDTDKKEAEIEKLKEKKEEVKLFQFSVLGGANSAMRSAAEENVSGKQTDTENNAFINASRLQQTDEQAAQQRFYVSFG